MEIEKLTSIGMYNLGDWFPGQPLKDQKYLRGMWDRQNKRAPNKGEWYLSGNPITAYKAPHDFTTSMTYHIAQIIKVRFETKTIVEEVLTEKVIA